MHTQTFHNHKMPLLTVWVKGKKHFQIMVYNFRYKKKSKPFYFKGWSYSNFMDGGKSRKLHCLDNSALIVLWPWPIYLNLHLPKMSFWNVLWEFSEGGGRSCHITQGLFKINITLEVKRKEKMWSSPGHAHRVPEVDSPVSSCHLCTAQFHLWASTLKMNLLLSK